MQSLIFHHTCTYAYDERGKAIFVNDEGNTSYTLLLQQQNTVTDNRYTILIFTKEVFFSRSLVVFWFDLDMIMYIFAHNPNS